MKPRMTVGAVEEVVEGDGFCVGAFWCPPDSPLWREENTIERGPCFVVPMTGVEILHARARPIITNPARVLFYNGGQPYRRRLLDMAGDRCLFFTIAPDAAHEALAKYGAARGADGHQPFDWSWGPLEPQVYLRARELYRWANSSKRTPDAIHEEVLHLLDAVVEDASTLHDGRHSQAHVGRRAQDAVDEVLRAIILRPEESLTLAALGGKVGLSPYHLARSFRACTGLSLHACRDRIRVLSVLDRLDSADRLVDIALEAGYSSHSHLTQAFRRVLHQTPTQVRRRFS